MGVGSVIDLLWTVALWLAPLAGVVAFVVVIYLTTSDAPRVTRWDRERDE